jgi:acetylornithine deacetylase
MRLDPVETLAALVAIPSVNPMGGNSEGSELAEARLTDHLEKVFKKLGLRHERQPVEPGRENILGVLDGRPRPEEGGTILLIDAHQDTVPVGGMTIPPWQPSVQGGRLYGRGACDVKGGMAAALAAISLLAESRANVRPTIVLACTINEEYGFSGVQALARSWGRLGGIIPRTPDVALVAEPTDLQVVVAHKGLVRWRCHARGRAAHSAIPQSGENAIYIMARALAAIERYARDVAPTLASHPLCGPATLSVGTIRGGVSVNTVPDRCTIEIDRRLVPGEEPEAARRHLMDAIQEEKTGAALEHDPPYIVGLPLSEQENGRLAECLLAVVGEVIGPSRPIGVPYATDAAFLAAAGVPSVVFGPGSIAQAHTADEWISIEQVKAAVELLRRFAEKELST